MEGIDGSQYRAWTLAHQPPKPGRGGDTTLGWLGYGQSMMLLLELVNKVDQLNTNLVRLSGGRARPHPIMPPGTTPPHEPRRLNGAGMGFTDFMNRSSRLFNAD